MSAISTLKKIIRYFNLESELENPEMIHEEIMKGVIFKGTNLWILIFAIVVASVGLNMNSTAVIIGAMLISPLMGPINGMGYSIATFDLALFRQSLKNFLFAVTASLVASTTYFALSPVSTAHSELLARTSPTIYDVLIALFGGLAGIVAISSKQKGNVIPGVAIATALMPPLCTAGYGLATGQFTFFLGAIYLFTINSIFIAMASVWISQVLKFPIRSHIDETRKKKINQLITVVITLVLLPSIYFGYKLVQQEKFTQNANQYVANLVIYEGNYLLKSHIDIKNKTIFLVYGGNPFTDDQKNSIVSKKENFHLSKAKIVIEQGLSFASFEDKNMEVYKLKEQINNLTAEINEKNAQLDSIIQKASFGKIILQEISMIYPEIIGCSYSEGNFYSDPTMKPNLDQIVIFTVKDDIADEIKSKIDQWLKKRLNTEQVEVVYNLK